jgi:uncharacterized protein (TIGR02231 family)
MLKKLLFISLNFIAMCAMADGDQKVPSKVQKVIIFLSGAQVTRNASVTINPGVSTLVFDGISAGIDAQSIQVKANGKFTILSVKSELNYLKEESKQKNIDDLLAQQKIINDKLQLANSLLYINQQEESMLMKNQSVKSDNANLNVTELKLALDFQTQRLTEIKKKQLQFNNEIADLNAQLQKYNQQIADVSNGNTKATSNIIVTVSSKETIQAAFALNYIVPNANWYPTYDIRAKDVNSPINITYKANVTQQTGEDWKNVKLTLSTGNPSVSGSKPELSPYYLNLQANYAAADYKSSNQLNEVVVVGYGIQRKLEDKVAGMATADVAAVAPSVELKENQTNFEFNIADPYSISSDGKQCVVEINQVSINATYQYAVAPKLSTNVFLTAMITDWNKYNMLPGEVNLFFEDTYIGKSVLNTNSTNDTLNISLGADKNIVVTRTLQKELTQKQSIGSNNKQLRDWVIEVRNHKNQPVKLLVEDQVPVSQNKDIEVEKQQLSAGKPDELTGKIAWNLLLKPQDDKKLELKYQVKFPKNQQVIVE